MPAPTPNPAGRFVAIDFETADQRPDSACSVGLITVSGTEIVDRTSFLIRPPRREFTFTHIHGITWEQVADQPTFGELWPQLLERLLRGEFVAAHNASFDRGVLMACCAANGLVPPPLRFLCTVYLAHKVWKLAPANLPAVCEHLSIPLHHHQAESDAEACARIVMAAREHGVSLASLLTKAGTAVVDSVPGSGIHQTPSKAAVVQQLDRLGELRLQRAALEPDKKALIDQIVTPAIRARLAEIDEYISARGAGLDEDIAALDAQVRAATLLYGQTVKGNYLSAQWAKGKTSWDAKGLNQYGQHHPEVLQFRKDGEPWVSIKSIGKAIG